MSFWNDDVRDSFDRMFDFNRDGKLDMTERSMQFEYLEEEEREFEADEYDEDDYDEDDYDEDDY